MKARSVIFRSKKRDISQESKDINVVSGGASSAETIVIRDDDEGWQTAQTRKQRQAKSRAEKRKKGTETGTNASGSEAEGSRKRKPTPNLPQTAIQTSNRPRTVGNQLQYYLYLMSRGQIITSELQNYINRADPVTFITQTKPSIKQKENEDSKKWA